MLIVRKEQMKAFEDVSERNFENEIIKHIRDYFPIHWRTAGEEALRRVVRLGIMQAEQYGLLGEREIYLYVSLMLYLGSHFHMDPLIPWAARYLTDKAATNSFQRIEKTFDRAMRYLNQCEGMSSEYLVSALKRAKTRLKDLSALPNDDPVLLLSLLYPEKCYTVGRGCVRTLIEKSRLAAKRYGIACNQGVNLYTCLAFFVGHGFDRDPQYPWAAEALGQGSGGSESETTAKLHGSALNLFEQWLS
jgi:hypothetical protein